MDIQLSEIELAGDRRGKIAAGIGFILFIVLLLIPIFFHLNPPPGQPGIAVLLAFDDAGSGDAPAPPASAPAPAEPAPVKPPPPTPEPEPEPVKPPPTPTKPEVQPEREVIQQETPAEIAIRKRKAQEEARKQEADRVRKQQEADIRRRQEATAAAAREEAAREQREREAREAAIAEANAKEEAARQRREANAARLRDQLGGGLSDNSGSGSGDSNKPGTQGDPNGVPGGAVTAGSGKGRVSGLGGRGLVSSPAVRESSQASGTVVISVCISPEGKVTSAKFSQSGSNTSNPSLIRAATNNAKTWKFSPDGTAPPTQCGKITYTFKVQ
jgi:TonB family protein